MKNKGLLPIPKILPILFLLVALLISSASQAQPNTLKVMQYNILNYGYYPGYCNETNNNVNDKNGYIRTILTAFYPDILTVCEMGKNSNLPNDFVANNLNINGIDYWKASAGSNLVGSSLINCIFYNSQKLRLTGHHITQQYIRDIDVYDFTIIDDPSAPTLTCVVAHLKAGSGADNEEKRKTMAQNTMSYLQSFYREQNVLIMGDFNLYGASEPAYQALINQTAYPYAYFIDPAYPYGVGEWNNNSTYTDYHTQSTHTDNNGCHSSGGMDDRFDFIMMSENIYGGRDGIRYIGGSYKAIGQDGFRFNHSINNPANQEVSQAVANALYNNSDHIPVTMKLSYGTQDVNELSANKLSFDIFPNPASERINIRFFQNNVGKANILLFNTLGQIVYSDDILVDECLSEHVISLDNIRNGFYFLKITNADGLSETVKVIVE